MEKSPHDELNESYRKKRLRILKLAYEEIRKLWSVRFVVSQRSRSDYNPFLLVHIKIGDSNHTGRN